MIKNEIIMQIKIELNNQKLSNIEIAKKYGVHRNTVSNIKKNISISINEQRKNKRRSKINDEYISSIKEFCLNNLNCYVYKDNPIAWAKYLCEKNNLKLRDLENYSPDKLDIYPPYRDRRIFLAAIRRIRSCTHISKNFKEVYEKYRELGYYDNQPITYDSFYRYAKKFWVNVSFNGQNLGEIIDKKIKYHI